MALDLCIINRPPRSYALLIVVHNSQTSLLPSNMASDHHRENPELRPFVLSNVTLTGTRIGAGAYGSVEEVTISGALCAAKKIHDVFQDRFEISEADFSRASTQFVKECQLMSTLRHPNIVQFLGVYFFEGSRLPALVMERLFTSLHHLLDPQMDPPPPADAPKPYFPLSLKCSILHNVASGLAFLHDRTPPIIHRDLSARNVATPNLRDVGQDSGPGHGSYRTPYECSHHDQGTWCRNLHAS